MNRLVFGAAAPPTRYVVTPANAGVQTLDAVSMDSGFRRNDGKWIGHASLALALLSLLATPVLAKGTLTNKVVRMEPLVLGNAESEFYMSHKEYRIETGTYYRWKITSSGRREYNIVAPELWRNSWIHQVKVGDKEIKVPMIEELDFDGAGDEEVYFVPIRAGTYEFRSRGLEERGMVGKIIVE
jgi:plastocyanin